MRFRLKIAFIPAILIAAFIVICPDNASGGRIDQNLKSRLSQISFFIYNDRFDEAGALIDSLGRAGFRPVFHHFARAALYQAQMMAAESDFLKGEYFDILDSLETDAKGMLADADDSAMAYCYLGHAFALRSLYHGRAGHFFRALKDGLAARKAYGRGYKIDPGFHDLALGLGSYRYWKSVKTKAINWTPLFKNEKQNGIELLRLAADSSEISADAAKTALIWVYINEKMFGRAIELALEMNRRYPRGLTFLWALGEAYFKAGDCRSAVDVYGTILGRLQTNPGNYYNIIEASYYLSECYRRPVFHSMPGVEKLHLIKERILSYPIPDTVRKRQKKKISAILKVLRLWRFMSF